MKILVTGSAGFVGKNLVEALKNLRDNKDRTRPSLSIDEIFEYDIDTDKALLSDFCRECDFVFNLAGVNRPKDDGEFMKGNFGFASELLKTLEKHGNRCPVMLSSSIQATLVGRYANSVYGESKLRGEELFLTMPQKPAQRCLFTASRIFSENGAGRITTVPLQPFATTSQTTYP